MLLTTVANGTVRLVVAVTTTLVEDARKRHDTLPTATAALGRALTAGLLLASNLKGEDILTIRFLGDGPLGAIIITADADNKVRGYVQEPHTHLPTNKHGKLDVGGAVGQGMLYISRDMGFGEPYTGSVELVDGEIAEDIARYLTYSEQTPSAVSLGVLVNTDNTVCASGGFLLQTMPGIAPEIVDALEKNLNNVGQISNLIARGIDAPQLVEIITAGLQCTIHEERTVEFFCPCSKERLEKVLISLGLEELGDIIESDGQAELVCHFCGEKHHFERKDLENLVDVIKGS